MSLLEIEFLAYVQQEIDAGWYGLGDGSYGVGLADELLPQRGRYQGANYRITLRFTGTEQGVETQIKSTKTTAEFHGEVTNTTVDFLAADEMRGYIPTHAFEATDDHPALEWEPTDCYVTLQLIYDPGMSCTPSRLQRDPPPDPDLEYTTQVTEGLQVDYRGRVTGTDTEQRFPRAINCTLPFGEVVLVALDPDSNGITETTYAYEEGRNLFAVHPTGKIAWIAEPVTDNGTTGYYYTLWRVDESLLAKPHRLGSSGRTTVTLDPETGDILAQDR